MKGYELNYENARIIESFGIAIVAGAIVAWFLTPNKTSEQSYRIAGVAILGGVLMLYSLRYWKKGTIEENETEAARINEKRKKLSRE